MMKPIKHPKTDTLIRVKDRNVFIAECLVWGGEAHLLSKMNEQLFQYAMWRVPASVPDAKDLLACDGYVAYYTNTEQQMETSRDQKERFAGGAQAKLGLSELVMPTRDALKGMEVWVSSPLGCVDAVIPGHHYSISVAVDLPTLQTKELFLRCVSPDWCIRPAEEVIRVADGRGAASLGFDVPVSQKDAFRIWLFVADAKGVLGWAKRILPITTPPSRQRPR